MSIYPSTIVRRSLAVVLALTITAAGQTAAQDLPSGLPSLSYHLTVRPFEPLGVQREAYLEVIEDLCQYLAGLQDAHGAVIDPLLHREHQYSTPYFAYAVGVLLEAGRAPEVRERGIRAMDHATRCLAGGSTEIPDRHGEFFIAPLAEALELYRTHVGEVTWRDWQDRLRTPLGEILENQDGRTNNWRTYAMKGEWLRRRHELVPEDAAIEFIEDAWIRRTQRERIARDKWNLYQDWSSDPQSHAVETVGRGNLLALVAAGYDGPNAVEIARTVRRGTEASLLWQAPDGQCPPNGRTDNHVFNDLLYQLAFEVMAERAVAEHDLELAGRFRRAALLSFRSLTRWQRVDEANRGAFFVTKNEFDPAERVGYQPASQITNYNATIAYHLAEVYRVRRSEIEEHPAPAELGGYVVAADSRFASVVANAGGMQVLANLRGDSVPKYGVYWTPLGVVRFGRAGWDGRLGPSDGVHEAESGQAATFAPTWREGARWVRLAERAEHYRGTLTTEFVHPLLVRFQILYHPVTGQGGPSFRHEFVVTPDGVLTTLHCTEDRAFGLTIPVLVDDGQPLDVNRTSDRISVAYPNERGSSGDEQNYLVLGGRAKIETEEAIRSAVGWLQPMRVTSDEAAISVFVYPRNESDPPAQQVLASFKLNESGFESCLGQVEGDVYRGRTSAGGHADRLDLNGDGRLDLQFDEPCGFVVQLNAGKPTAVEVDRAVTVSYENREQELEAFRPVSLESDSK